MSTTSPRPDGPVYRSVGGVIPSNAPFARIRSASGAGADYGAPGDPDWRGIDWSQHVHDVQIEGRRLRYVDYGEGSLPAVLFVHGWTSNWQAWLENIPAAAATGRRVIAVDLPGSGMSEMPVEKITISNYARTLMALCEHLGIEKAIPVGNSMGGFVSAELAIRAPDLVDRLVLVSAAGLSTAAMRQGPVVAFARVLQIGLAQGYTHSRSHPVLIRPKLRHRAAGTIFRHPTRIPTDLLYEMMGGMGKDGFQDQLMANITYDYTERIPEIGCPTLVVWGREDMVVPVSDALEYDRLIPDARLLIMDDTGHVAMAERPPAFNKALAEFMVEQGSAELQPNASV
ncbi:MAG: hypothetical protein QOG62_1087 [Thermoleophilaceae bacterium]|jgi:pimeloyl-ACP methyl ester carboxylesterase|nr:hypothetical protein [Thermoleophilaceae bacterium]